MSNFYPRHLSRLLGRLVHQFPSLLITGPRQVGKSTLLQHFGSEQEEHEPYQYVTFDDPLVLNMAKNDGALFFLNHSGKLILDEVQYAPELFSLLKLHIDREKQNGRYLLSGSQAFELMKHVNESLAGRIAVLKLQGLSLREICRNTFDLPFIPNADYLAAREKNLPDFNGLDLWQTIHKGYMPRLYEQEMDWQLYYASYVATYIERDVRELIAVNNPNDFTTFMIAVASRSGELLNYSNIAGEVGVSVDTVKRWLAVLQTSGIVYLLQPYSNNHLKRAIKTPKVYFLDTGLMAYLTRWLTAGTLKNGAKSGQFFETFVVGEIIKSFYNAGLEPPLYYYRDTNQKEIDLIIEHDRTIYPVEIKQTASPTKKMAAAFDLLRNQLPPTEISVAHGTILNQYPQKLWLDQDLLALPLGWV
ncbi:hypothetical protein EDC44_10644 [Cricetibacter osteomyelitidis]|uniref:AAA+ ATPase domain-containing protein n=1 Tax=Cricetibacter osteomyelitidis TaxID=1521931 RepID=A0A4R2T208_9PAST|nr:ATP-binding protein [Cricetibacter osteomyelitidis]TCP95985.1 hypothetical protein EDC44_10644 [Cricetibacter osteomyelitidis]